MFLCHIKCSKNLSLHSASLLPLQQDSAPAYQARETLNLMERETAAYFISPDIRPLTVHTEPSRLQHLESNAAADLPDESS